MLSNQEKREIILVYGESGRNLQLTSRVLQERFPQARYSLKKVRKIVRLFEDTSSVVKPKRVYFPVRHNDALVQVVRNAVEEDPNVSTRIIARQHNISKSSFQRILKSNKFHPYKISLHQELRPGDYESRMEFCQHLIHLFEENNDLLNFVLFSDEATFKSNELMNRHNMHYWAVENPRWMRQVDHQRVWSLNVWGGILGQFVIGPFFFDGEMYLNFLRRSLMDLLENVPLNIIGQLIFMHDGAPPHFARRVRRHLDRHPPERWIGRGGPLHWPARSPDLTPCDFFLWGVIKEKVYKTAPTTVDDMKDRIRAAFAEITPETLIRVKRSFRDRLLLCLQANGNVFEHLMCKH
ncbi:Transposable element Tc3 transposase-like Protein [Tribolium castaneum]|uniref:Transposable element Tc3 transposase-like Protein n=1 Tax=Tribolium castaneum TaxID=7070 RepID=D6WUK1_TRICA|nr:Transposable element Tc3 transposase-like Protein [Tribolium castaneum]